MISVAQLSFTHPGDTGGFDDVTFAVPPGGHAALIGDNGVGKTTLLRILAGQLQPDDGQAQVQGSMRYMPQEVGFEGDAVAVQELLCRFAPAPLDQIGIAMFAAERRLAAGDDEAGFELAERMSEWGDLGGYELQALWDAASRTIIGTGFDAVAQRDATTLSGGERKRLVLEVLLGSPIKTLLLDEPDNYLDIPAKRRLERQLADSDQTILLVSHDRELLSTAPTRLITLEPGGAWIHHGTYADYDEAREARQQSLGDELRRWQDEERRLFRFYKTMKQRAAISDVMASKADAAETRWRKWVEAGPPPPPAPDQTVSMQLMGSGSGKRMLRLTGLAIPGLVHPFSDEIHHGERVGLIGPNGTGKTHLVRTVAAARPAGELAADQPSHQGEVVLGARVRAGYFAQVTTNPAMSGSTPLAVVTDATGNEQRSMAALARYGLTRTARQIYETLSGGQKARLEILLLELSGVNLLILDEPTDNLDLESCRALETALDGFDGAIVAVSHDRTFLRGMSRHLHLGEDGRVFGVADFEAAMAVLMDGLAAATHGAVVPQVGLGLERPAAQSSSSSSSSSSSTAASVK
ncbi:ABC-F family ATP-binding cassette domain-containing protein [Euzebya tangerina]|uniref:ABC-F family ATP-binding cassette domain-containing protein n=1 Tax=Euzebya tangerina TaxID=591198 RepID=UPI000E3191A2|nr:ATP-binding cassette domain-containing protein [Euzebya tangerina]